MNPDTEGALHKSRRMGSLVVVRAPGVNGVAENG
jgi:hypothetical protein